MGLFERRAAKVVKDAVENLRSRFGPILGGSVYHVGVAYLLWFFGGFGMMGLHRFYLNKIPTGILWFFTGGMGLIGAAYDFFTLAKQVETANLLAAHQKLVGTSPQGLPPQSPREKESLEKLILRTAKNQNGRLTASQAALEGDWKIEDIQKELDRMAKKGICELRVLKSGGMLYYFAEFDPHGEKDFEV